MNDRMQTMAALLLELERELRAQMLWSDQVPPQDALRGDTPFAADTLAFENWLQWIFIPRIRLLIETDAPLPGVCEIHPYAEECLRQYAMESGPLLDVLRRIDHHISSNE